MSQANEQQVALQLYTLRKHLKTPPEIGRALEKVAAAGYAGVELAGLGQIAPEELKKMVSDNGLKIVSAHVNYLELVEKTPEVAAKYNFFGAGYIAVGSLPGSLRNLEGYRQAARELSRAGEILSREGIRLGYHNHHFELERHGDRTGLEMLLEESDPRYLDMEIDTYWITAGGGSPAAWCRRCAGRLTAVHLKDMAVIDGQQVMAEVGEGNLDWPSIIDACREAGSRLYIVEQDECRRDPFESVAISRKNLENILA